MLIEINPDNPQNRYINQVAEQLQKGKIIIYPTDSVYGLACDILNQKGIDRICRLRKLNPVKANLTMMFTDLSQLSEYTQPLNNQIFRFIKRNIPGPITFILQANNKVPKMFKNKKRTLGIRISENRIVQELVNTLGRPMLSLSLKEPDEITEYLTDPFEIHENYHKLVDLVIDGGMGNHQVSTIVDCTSGEIEVLREGAGEILY